MEHSTRHRHLATLLLGIAFLATAGGARAQEGPHDGATCGLCHDGGGIPDARSATAQDACLGCHAKESLPTATLVRSHGTDGRRCLACHSFHEPALVTSRAGTIDLNQVADAGKGHCAACHDQRGDLHSLSPAHEAAAFFYHDGIDELQKSSPSQGCLNCHSNLNASNWQSMAPGKALAFNQHASHPYGVRVMPGMGDSSNWIAKEIDPRLNLFEGKIECQTCHLLTADNDDLLVPFPGKYDLCKGCHRHYGDKENGRELFATMVKR